MEVAERLALKRKQRDAERDTVTGLKQLINNITATIGLDEERMNKRIDSALQSEYGRINGMVNLLASIAHWPAEAGDGASVTENRKVLEDKLTLDLLTLADIRMFRGYHTFYTDDLELMSGQEPQYEDYTDYVAIFLEDLGLTAGRVTINPEQWNRAEAVAKTKAIEEVEKLKLEVARHKELMAEQA